MSVPRRILSPAGWVLPFALVCLWICLPATGALDTVAGLFQAARYGEALAALDQGAEGLRAGEETLWRARLATQPAEALAILREGMADKRLPGEVKTRLVLETAGIEFGLGHYQSSLQALAPLLNDDEALVPGDAYLTAGLSLRALGDLQKAREMLASVKPRDPAFTLARYYLGDIALEQNDAGLALRYFDAAAQEGGAGSLVRIAGGRWRALRADGRDPAAEKLAEDLTRDAPGSLAMLEIQRIIRAREEELAAMALPESAVPASSAKDSDRGRYALQLGAFSDRGLALEFVRNHRDQLSDLRIDEVRDERGQFLYKVRTGSFVNPAQARTEARQLARQLDIEVFVADLSGTDDRTD